MRPPSPRPARAHDQNVRVCVPRDVVQKVILHRRAQREAEAVPIGQNVRADARAVHQPDAFERNEFSVIVAKVEAVGPDHYGMDLKLPENAFRFERYIKERQRVRQ